MNRENGIFKSVRVPPEMLPRTTSGTCTTARLGTSSLERDVDVETLLFLVSRPSNAFITIIVGRMFVYLKTSRL
jgi:hypothetical protein